MECLRKEYKIFMRKTCLLCFVLIMIFVLGACASSTNKEESDNTAVATNTDVVLTIDGGETITVRDLINLKKENEAKFKNNYMEKSVSFIGTVKEIRYDYYGSSVSEMTHYDEITFEGNIILIMHHGDHDDILNQLSKGDRVNVHSKISYCNGFNLETENIVGMPWKDDSSIEIIQ